MEGGNLPFPLRWSFPVLPRQGSELNLQSIWSSGTATIPGLEIFSLSTGNGKQTTSCMRDQEIFFVCVCV